MERKECNKNSENKEWRAEEPDEYDRSKGWFYTWRQNFLRATLCPQYNTSLQWEC